MPEIVISCRSGDSSALASRIGERLVAHYGRNAVHLDAIDDATGVPAAQRVLVAIVGPRWLGPTIDGRAAIHQRSDAVRNRIETALGNGIAVVPVTVGGSRTPRPTDLPESIRDFVSRPAVEIDGGRDFSRQLDRLIALIDRHLLTEPKIEVAAPSLPQMVPAAPTCETADASRAPAPVFSPTACEGKSIDRATPEYWLHYAEVERKLAPGDAPLVMLSYASEDLVWVGEVQAFIDPKIEHLRDPGGQPYQLWQFSDMKRGTTPGDEFPAIVAEKMWRCRVALVLLSKDYFTSRYCRQIELPFLMWRREHHRLLCMPLRLGALPADRVRLPAYSVASRNVFIDDLIDDRQAPANFAVSPHRDLTLKQLKEQGYESEIESRFEGVARLVVDFLKKTYQAIDE
jgi:hypothetical protein